MAAEISKPAPDFAVGDHTGRIHRLADYRGRRLVLWFFPKAQTPGCTKEGCSFRDLAGDFAAKGAAILGVSVDPPEANAAFAKSERFTFPLLSDTTRAMSVAYGACDAPTDARARRAGVVVGRDGRIESLEREVDAASWPAAVLARL